jgi:5-methylthioadenosine/S-adenosylhomocysteine deaminase
MHYNPLRDLKEMDKERTVIQGATVITLDADNRIFTGDVIIERGRVAGFAPPYGAAVDADTDDSVDGYGCVLLPGFVQTHVHLCQTLFRGAADDLSLIDWLRKRVWPMEAAHTQASLRASARLGIAELIRGGTTAALTMETVNHTETVIEAVIESGFRATVGKCMMDVGEEVPAGLRENTEASIAESVELIERFHGSEDGRVRCCFAPRFAVSCTEMLLREVARLSRERGVLVHTHASENRDEIAMVERSTGKRNIVYLADTGLAAPHVVLAHCIHINDEEMEILQNSGAHVAHCPSSNLKLASGVARVPEMLGRGIRVSLGADGAACNNRLDMFTEMRTAALIQKVLHGPEAMPASAVLRMATVHGAHAIGLSDEIGTIEVGKRADLQLINLNRIHTTPAYDPVSAIVYAAEAGDVEWVWIDGRAVLREGRLTTLDEADVVDAASREAEHMNRTWKRETTEHTE